MTRGGVHMTIGMYTQWIIKHPLKFPHHSCKLTTSKFIFIECIILLKELISTVTFIEVLQIIPKESFHIKSLDESLMARVNILELL